jgi:hypothetical protein
MQNLLLIQNQCAGRGHRLQLLHLRRAGIHHGRGQPTAAHCPLRLCPAIRPQMRRYQQATAEQRQAQTGANKKIQPSHVYEIL